MERAVQKDTALFVLKTALDAVAGYGASQRTKFDFEGQSTISELLQTLEQLTGPEGWKWLQKKAQIG